MEQRENPIGMLDLIASPAFSVEKGEITAVNRAAAQCMIEPGIPVADLLTTGKEEYEDFSAGSLYLQLCVCEKLRGVSITRIDGRDIFVLEDESESESLQALSLAARELRTPLSGLLATVDRLFPKLDEDADDTTQEQMALINRNLFQLLRLVGNMSDAAHYNGESRRPMETRDICAVIQEIFDQVDALAEELGVTVRLKNLHEILYCPVDQEMLERAIYNLLSNALRFSPKGSTIQAAVTKHGKRLYLTVQDCGSGISAQMLGSIYTNFQRAPGIEDSRHGIGLGMLLIRAAALAHGGTVLIQPGDQQGTKITMSISLDRKNGNTLHSPVLKIDYAGERSHALIELSDVLPPETYLPININ